MRTRTLAIAAAILLPLHVANAQSGSNWGQFRGPGGLGVGAEGQKLPTEFSASKNLAWKTPISKGHSSPCVWGDRIFLTGFSDDKLETICIHKDTGKILWRRSVEAAQVQPVHPISSPATPTPTTDGKSVFVYFGSYGLIAYDFDGNEQWKRPIPMPRLLYGTASSPIVAGEYLILADDNKSESYLEAIKLDTGETAWKVDRTGFTGTWSTPMHWRNRGVDEVVVYGIWWMKAYDLRDGTERWSVPRLTDEPAITPVHGDGLVYLTSYNMKTNPEVINLPPFAQLLKEYDKDDDKELSRDEIRDNKSILSRFDADGEGDHPLRGFFRRLDLNRNGKITEEEWGGMIAFLDSFEQDNALLAIRPGDGEKQTELVWKHRFGVPECPSPLYLDGRVYMVKNGGIVTCLDAKTGEKKYMARLGSGGPYYGSPVAGDGKIFVPSARGVVTVFEQGDELNVLARNDLAERIMATPAIVDGVIFVRTEEHLFAFRVDK